MSKENEVVENIENAEETSVKKTNKKVEKKEEKKKAIPKLFFNPDIKVEVAVNGYHSNETGALMFVIPKENDNGKETFDNLFTKVEYKFWFTRVPYDKFNRYRSRSMIYNAEDQNNTINELKLREFLLVFHLSDWNLTDDEGKKIELKFDQNGALSDETLDMIYKLPSNLLDTVLSTFERTMGM